MGISTHVLETSLGLPAAGLRVSLERFEAGSWAHTASETTDADGRCKRLLPEGCDAERGQYRVRFETGEYFRARRAHCLYPCVEITFEVSDDRHHHIPLLLTANGYTTYRGS